MSLVDKKSDLSPLTLSWLATCTKVWLAGTMLVACSDNGGSPFADSAESASLPPGTTGSEANDAGDDGNSGANDSSGMNPGEGSGGASTAAEDGPSDGEESGEEGDDEIRFDVMPMGDNAGEIHPIPGDGDELRSYIWISNSEEGSISKIDTETMIEEGRYRTAEEPNNPSRSSVDLNGNVAVAGRAGGITKIAAGHLNCVDKNGSGGISTSLDSNMLDWGKDECVLWYTETAYEGQRAVAWTQGVKDPDTGTYSGQNLWVASFDLNPANSKPEAYLYDGETGDEIGVVVYQNGIFTGGAYGGAVDSKGNFWFINYGGGYLFRADLETLTGMTFPIGHHSYGMTVDSNDYVWTCSSTIARFDPRTQSWRRYERNLGNPDLISRSELGGCMVDQNGILWHSGIHRDGSKGILGFDTNELRAVDFVKLPEHSHGIAVDFHGYVWGIGLNTDHAMRVDTRSKTFKTFEGLVGAYTYSDMTGFTLYSTLPPVAD